MRRFRLTRCLGGLAVNREYHIVCADYSGKFSAMQLYCHEDIGVYGRDLQSRVDIVDNERVDDHHIWKQCCW